LKAREKEYLDHHNLIGVYQLSDRFRVERRISFLKDKIYELNCREESEISEAEIRKIQKTKSKLVKQVDKLMKKLYSIFDE